MEYNEDDYIMLSALQHYIFCPRQCYLIHVEKRWEENFLTMKGKFLHEKVHSLTNEKRNDLYIVRSLRLVSKKYGITGSADIVEFNLSESYQEGITCRLIGKEGWWIPQPIEYKKGSTREQNANNVQLCAQALCIEEMFNLTIKNGVIYHGDDKRREVILFDPELRRLTTDTINQTHELINSGIIPFEKPDRACKSCSLVDICMPNVPDNKSHKYVNSIFEVNFEKTS